HSTRAQRYSACPGAPRCAARRRARDSLGPPPGGPEGRSVVRAVRDFAARARGRQRDVGRRRAGLDVGAVSPQHSRGLSAAPIRLDLRRPRSSRSLRLARQPPHTQRGTPAVSSRRRAGRRASMTWTRLFSLIFGTILCATSPAWGHGVIGQRFFPATLAIDDPFVADELSL